MTEAELTKLLEDKTSDLTEHFDAVQILASYQTEDGGTRCIKRGSGNWYARHGMAEEFVRCHREDSAAETLARVIKDEE